MVERHDLADVIPQERAPRLRKRLAPAADVFHDGRLTDVDPEFEEFAVNLRRAAIRVRSAIVRIRVRMSAGREDRDQVARQLQTGAAAQEVSSV